MVPYLITITVVRRHPCRHRLVSVVPDATGYDTRTTRSSKVDCTEADDRSSATRNTADVATSTETFCTDKDGRPTKADTASCSLCNTITLQQYIDEEGGRRKLFTANYFDIMAQIC